MLQPALPRVVALSRAPAHAAANGWQCRETVLIDTPVTGAPGTRGARPARRQLQPPQPPEPRRACCLGGLRCMQSYAASSICLTEHTATFLLTGGGAGGDLGLHALLPPSTGEDDRLNNNARWAYRRSQEQLGEEGAWTSEQGLGLELQDTWCCLDHRILLKPRLAPSSPVTAVKGDHQRPRGRRLIA